MIQMTVKPATDPRSLSSILGATIRIAQRMGIHDESANSKHPALEAELRRRLWWSLVLFDARISEMADFRLGLLVPTWDCKLPSNANDFDFRLEMRTPPEVHTVISEALFAVVRGEFGNFIRHCSSHLDFINPALKSIAKIRSSTLGTDGDELSSFGRMIEETYLQHCDPQNPLHFMTIWWSRGQLAKSHFVKFLSDCAQTPRQPTDAQRDAGVSYALSMLECDTKVMSSSHLKSYRWLIYLNFPFPAYVHIVQDLRKRPLSAHAQLAWKTMSENCAVRFVDVDARDKYMETKENIFFKVFAGVVFQAWAARQTATAQVESYPTETPPQIVTQIKQRMDRIDRMAIKTQNDRGMQYDADDGVNTNGSDPSMSMGVNMDGSYGTDHGLVDMQHWFPAFGEEISMGFDAHSWAWPTANLYPMLGEGW
jgi:hypothetical protein